ncbi:MAG: TolC family outer membrane protein [Bdellovibrionales bacterium]
MRGFLILTFVLIAMPANAQSFEEALAMAYQNNPELRAEQAALRALDSGVTEAQSGWRPTAEAGGSAGVSWNKVRGASSTTQPKAMEASIIQPIFRGGRTTAAIRAARARVMAGRASLLQTEQDVLLGTAIAYLNALRDEAVLNLNQKNENVLNEQLNASQSRFDVGTITKTDVSQSESRLARAQADRISAEGNLSITRANFARYVGQPPATINVPELNIKLPESLEAVIGRAERYNPLVEAAIQNEAAADSAIDEVKGTLYPEVNVVANTSRSFDQAAFFGGRIDQSRLLGELRIPLYSAGADYARLKAARETATQRKLQIDDARRIAREQAVAAWESLQAAKAAIIARDAQTQAADLALTGVRREADVGTRTTLDTLDAEQELLDARVSYITAERDVKVATLQVLAAMGEMTAETLGLKVAYYDPKKNYDDVDGAWFGE